jgi:hypothetical protein
MDTQVAIVGYLSRYISRNTGGVLPRVGRRATVFELLDNSSDTKNVT